MVANEGLLAAMIEGRTGRNARITEETEEDAFCGYTRPNTRPAGAGNGEWQEVLEQ